MLHPAPDRLPHPMLPLFVGLIASIMILLPAHAALAGYGHLAGKSGWFAFAFGSALLLGAACWSRGAGAFGLAALALIVGGAADLWLTEPRYFPIVAKNPSPLMLGLIAMQGAISLALLWPRRAIFVQLMRAAGPGTVAFLFLISVLLSVSFYHYGRQGAYLAYAKQIVFSTAILGVVALNIAALVCVPGPAFLRRLPSLRLSASVALIAAALMAWLGFGLVPHVEDELVYLFHARTFLSGSLGLPAPSEVLRPGLEFYLIDITEDRWFAVTTPGWPAALALAEAFGAPWMLNPLMTCISVLLAYRLFDSVTDRRTALLGAALMATSPWLLSSAGALMGHLVSLAATLGAWVLLISPKKTVWRFVLAGALMGFVFTVRQLEGAILGGVTGLLLLPHMRNAGGMLRVIAYGLGCLAIGALYFAYNHAMTGSFLVSPLQVYIDALWHPGANGYGFGPEHGPKGWSGLDYAPGHDLKQGIIGTWHTASILQFEYLGWSVGSLVLPLVFLLRGKKNRLDWLAVAISTVIVLAHIPYWFPGSFYIGPRYWFGLFVPLVYLSARGGVLVLDAMEARLATDLRPSLWVLFSMALFTFATWQGTEKYHNFGEADPALAASLRSTDFGDSIVVYSGPADPGSYLILNHPALPADRPIFLFSADNLDLDAIRQAYPERQIVQLP